MAGTITHFIFGTELLGRLAAEVGEGAREREAFLLGNLGPDPFFFLAPVPGNRRFRRVGNRMHGERPDELLEAVHTRFVAASDADAMSRAYGMGFLCHYLLDSAVHPLVIAEQRAICAAGGLGVSGRRASRAVHAAIETAVDEWYLTVKLGETAQSFPPHREMLRCSTAVLRDVSPRMADVLADAYGMEVPSMLFAAAVRANRVAQRMLDSKSGGLRRYFDYLEALGVASPYVRMLSCEGRAMRSTPLANEDHIPWKHPFVEDAIIDASFDELYQAAFDRAIATLPAFGSAGFAPDACRAISASINFSGKPVG